MNANNTVKPKQPIAAERPFPWRCRQCGRDEVYLATIAYDAEVRHDGRLYQFKVANLTAPICQACKKMVVTEDVDDQINTALRTHLSYLSPDEIRAGLARVGLTQKDAAEYLGIAEATLSRWLNESQIQSRAMDNLLRAFFAFPQVRSALQTRPHDPHFGTSDAVSERGKSAAAANLAELAPDVAAAFPTAESVNETLRALMKIARRDGTV